MFEVHYSHIGRKYVSTRETLHIEKLDNVLIHILDKVAEILDTDNFKLVKDYYGHYVVMLDTAPVGCVTIRCLCGL